MSTDQPTNQPEQPTGRWPKGMNTAKSATALRADELRHAHNVDFDKAGKSYRRKGRDLLFAGYAHSGFSDELWPYGMYVSEGTLYRVEQQPNGAISRTSHYSVSMLEKMSYTIVNDRLMYTNGQLVRSAGLDGDDREWGVEQPPGQPLLSASAGGSYDEGKYQVAITFVSLTGEESGTGLASEVTLAQSQSIMLSSIPQPVDTTLRLRIYCTATNGDALYQVREIASGITTYLLDREHYPGKMLATQFCERVPPSRIVRMHKGRVYFVIDDMLCWTEPLRYGLYKPHENYVKFTAPPNMVESVDDGLFVGTGNRTMFLPGSDPKKFEQRVVDQHGTIPGTGLQLRGSHFGDEQYSGPVAVWWSNSGNLLLGTPGGRTKSLTEQRLSMPSYEAGATIFRESGGMKHLLSVLRNPNGSGFSATDDAVAEVVRNGVVI